MICQWSPLLADWAFIVESSFSETSFTPTLSWTKTTFLRKRQLRPGEFLTSGSLRAHSEEEASGTERDGQGVWQEDLALLVLLQLYWLEPCVELHDVAALYRLSYAPLRRKHYLRNEVTVFFGRYILSARSLSELSGGNCAQSRPRLYSSRAQPHSVFFRIRCHLWRHRQLRLVGGPMTRRWLRNRHGSCFLFPVSFSLLAQDPWAAPRAHTVSCPAMMWHTNIYTSERG